MSELSARLFLLLQRVLPTHLLTALVFRIARIRVVGIKNRIIRTFIRMYDVNTDEVEGNIPDDFADFNEFFIRGLKPGSRAISSGENNLVSPVDGTVSAIGTIDDKQVFQAKGINYDLADLLATDLNDVDVFADGHFATIYLAPYNYHRVHCPLDATLTAARYVPGDLFSVNAATVSLLPRLFARNERLILHFMTADGPMIVILVGALNVGSISTLWTGQIRPRKHGVVEDVPLDFDRSPRRVPPGGLLGWFNFGSTVILLFPKGRCSWRDDLASGSTVRMGESLGNVVGTTRQ